MDNEYSQFENLIQDVTSIDTARMTLRWALERLNALGKANRELDEKLISAVESQKSSEKRMKEMEEMVASRMKLLGDQEAFYKKLEQTVNLLAEGKVDIVQIAKKEVDLDRVRQEISDQYKNQLEAMERANREMVAKWTQRLLEAESFNPNTLSDVLKKYDEYRRGIDDQYQQRALALEKGIYEREARLADRERELESAYQSKVKEIEDLRIELRSKVEGRTKDLEVAHDLLRAQVQRELEEKRNGLMAEAEALKELLHQDFRSKTQIWHSDQLARLTDLQKAWDAEKQQLLYGNRDATVRLKGAAKRIEELELLLSTSDAKHQEDMLKHIAESEYAFQQKIKEFEHIQSDARAALEARAMQLEKEHSARREDLEKFYGERIAAREDELKREKAALDAERRALVDEVSRTENRVQQAQQEVAKIRETMARQREMLDAQASDRLAAQDRLAREQISQLQLRHAEQTQQLEGLWLTEKQRLLKDLAARDSNLAKAYADLELMREKLTQDLEVQLKIRADAEAERRKVLEANWHAERVWLMRELETREVAMSRMRDELKKSQGELTETSIRAQDAVESLREKLRQETALMLKARDEQEAARMNNLDAKWERQRQSHQDELTQLENRADAERRALEGRFAKERARHQAEQAELDGRLEAQRHEMQSNLASEQKRHLEELKQTEVQAQGRAAALEDRWKTRELRLIVEIKEVQAREAERRQALEAKWKEREAELLAAVRHVEADAEGKRFALETKWKSDEKRLNEEIREVEAKAEAKREALEARWKAEQARLNDEIRRAEAAGELYAKALEAQFDGDRQVLIQETRNRESALERLRQDLSAAQNAIVAAAAESQKSAEALRTQLTKEFEETLNIRGKEEGDRRAVLESTWRAEKVRLLEEVTRVETQFKQAQDEILNLRDLIDKQKKSMESEQLHARQAWEASASAKLRAAQDDHRRQLQQLQLGWDKDKELFLKELQARDESLGNLTEQLHIARENLSTITTRAHLDLDTLKGRLQAEFQEKMKLRETQEAERRRSMESGWRAERERLLQEMLIKEQELQRAQNVKEEWQTERVRIIEEMMIRERQLAQYQEESSMLKSTLAKQREAIEAELSKSWNSERHRFMSELEAREQSLKDLTRQLESTRGSLVKAQTEIQANSENLRTKLTLEFQQTLKMREDEAADRQRAVEAHWEAEKSRLNKSIGDLEDKAEKMQNDFDAKIRELEKSFNREKEILIENLEAEYSKKKDMLLAACEGYRKELEARERAVKQWEDQDEQGK